MKDSGDAPLTVGRIAHYFRKTLGYDWADVSDLTCTLNNVAPEQWIHVVRDWLVIVHERDATLTARYTAVDPALLPPALREHATAVDRMRLQDAEHDGRRRDANTAAARRLRSRVFGRDGGKSRRYDIDEVAFVRAFDEARRAKSRGVDYAIDAARTAVKARRGTKEYRIGRTLARQILARHNRVTTRVRKA